MQKVNFSDKFTQFNEHWSPRIVGELNGQYVKLAKVEGEFVWHKHDNEDELFMVVKGKLFLDFRDKTIELNPGEFFIVPRGVEHRPRTEDEVHLVLFEPKATLNTGEIENERTVEAAWL